MFQKVPAEIWAKFSEIVDDAELEYVDNYRAYRVSDNFLKAEYCEAESQGCCGFFDVFIADDKGEDWHVGCNHGH